MKNIKYLCKRCTIPCTIDVQAEKESPSTTCPIYKNVIANWQKINIDTLQTTSKETNSDKREKLAFELYKISAGSGCSISAAEWAFNAANIFIEVADKYNKDRLI